MLYKSAREKRGISISVSDSVLHLPATNDRLYAFRDIVSIRLRTASRGATVRERIAVWGQKMKTNEVVERSTISFRHKQLPRRCIHGNDSGATNGSCSNEKRILFQIVPASHWQRPLCGDGGGTRNHKESL